MNTTRHPNIAKDEKKLSQAESEAVMQKCYKRLELAQLGTAFALGIFAILLIINIFIEKTTLKNK
jgi:hypothetical protein